MYTSCLARLAAACRLRPVVALFLLNASLAAGSPSARDAQRAGSESARSRAVVSGTVVDPLGAVVAQATVALLRDGEKIADTSSGSRGEFSFDGVPQGRYQIEVRAAGFQPRTSDAIFVASGGHAGIEIGLQIGAVAQQVVVSATAGAVPQSQIGAAVTVLDATMIEALGNTDLLEPLRTTPGAAIMQVGGRGGTASVFVRGGASNFTKVLIDGVPANDIGGGLDIADLATTGIDRVEVLRGSNSVLYGSDALAGVITITTRRGQTRIPEASFAVDGGNLGTSHEEASIGGALKRFDYFGAFSHLQTSNDVPNNDYRNNTFATRLGVVAGATTSVSGTVRRVGTGLGSPNAFNYYGIADDSSQDRTTTYASIAAQSLWSPRWTTTARFSVVDQEFHNLNPSPTGVRSDPSAFANYLGNRVTITGPEGRTVTGRAILDFSGTYPSPFDATFSRRLLYGDAVFRATQAFDLAGGVRVEDEDGTSGTRSKTARTNSGAFVEARGAVRGYLYVNGGLGFDHNDVFGFAWTPRLSAAAYLRRPSSTASLGDTKLTVNAGKGIKEPSLGQELSSLFALVPAATASALGVQPVGPERSRNVDVGIEQGLAGGRGRVRVSYFNNEFFDLIEFVSRSVLPRLGVPADAATASGFGAYVNAQSNKSSGIELSAEGVAGPMRLLASYTYVDATVTKSFSSGTLSPAINPAFPGIPIGQFSPLVGARPFRRPANSGSVVVSYSTRRAQAALAGYFVGARDDSTFLTDEFFGFSLLLPNQDLDPAYQKLDLSGSYAIHPRVRTYVAIENLFNQTYAATAGFPSLPRAARIGVRLGF
jgi:iron complex outermembrane receptor protein/vitamin B12 transporter